MRPARLNPHAARVAALLALVATFIAQGNALTAQGALGASWAQHARWPLGLDETQRTTALGALVHAQKALAILAQREAA